MGAVSIAVVFNVLILVFIAFEIINHSLDARSTVSRIKLPTSFLHADREGLAAFEETLRAVLPPPALPSGPVEDLSLTKAYSEYTNPDRPVSHAPDASDEPSYYLEWIRRDLEPWAKSGITEELIDAGAHNWSCAGERLRFNIIDGQLWVEHLSWRPREGWYPAKLGPGNMSAKGKVPYIIFALLDVLRAYPGKIPDVEVAVHTADFPCIHRRDDGTPPPIVMAPNSGYRFADLVFPDYSYYGHEHSWLFSPDDTYLVGWEVQAEFTAQKWANYTLLDRIPQVMWRGRTFDAENPQRDAMRRNFTACADSLPPEDGALWNIKGGAYMLSDLGDFRYNMYLESEAWVTNLRLKLSCGSAMLSNRMEYYEFFTRALVPGFHYVEVDQDDMCSSALAKIKAMEDALQHAAGPLPQGAGYPVARVWDWAKFRYSDAFMEHQAAVKAAAAIGGGARRRLQQADDLEEGEEEEEEEDYAPPQRARRSKRRPRAPRRAEAATARADGFPGLGFDAGEHPGDALLAAAVPARRTRGERPGRGAALAAQQWPAADRFEATQDWGEEEDRERPPPAEAKPAAARQQRARGDAAFGGPQLTRREYERPHAAGAAAAAAAAAHHERPPLDALAGARPGARGSGSSSSSARRQPAPRLDLQRPQLSREEYERRGSSAERAPHAPLRQFGPLLSREAYERRDAGAGGGLPDSSAFGPPRPIGPPSGLKPLRLEGGRTPMQLHQHLRGQADQFAWGKVEPWQVPVNSGQFVRDHVRMVDVRRYLRDLLREYAALQTFKPAKHQNSVCYTGRLLLEQFGNPHARDEHIIRQAYPWLADFDPGCPKLPQPGEDDAPTGAAQAKR